MEVTVSIISGDWWRRRNLKIDLWKETPSFASTG
jgi:hypothetical protein